MLEKTDEAGKKVRISGGTRCNVLPSTVELPRDYFTDSSTSALRAVFRWVCQGVYGVGAPFFGCPAFMYAAGCAASCLREAPAQQASMRWRLLVSSLLCALSSLTTPPAPGAWTTATTG